MPAKPVPDGYHTLTPHLIVKGAAKAIAFYEKAFGATVTFVMPGPDGRIGHAEIRIGDSPVMLADEHPEVGARGPGQGDQHSASYLLYVEDVDRVFARAVAAGARQLRPVADQFYGDRSGMLADPFGHVWSVATHKEDLTPEEMNRRAAAMR
jgi:PhnB protein